MQDLFRFVPVIQFKQEEDNSPPIFDLSFDALVSEHSGLPPFPECLPAENKAILESFQNLKDHITGALQELPLISHDVDMYLEEAKEFYELCPEAAAKKGLSMMEAVKSSKATGSNLRTLNNVQELFLVFGENVKRIADELAASEDALDVLMNEIYN